MKKGKKKEYAKLLHEEVGKKSFKRKCPFRKFQKCTITPPETSYFSACVLTSWLLADLMAGLAGWGEGLLYPSRVSMASAAWRLASFLLGPTPLQV